MSREITIKISGPLFNEAQVNGAVNAFLEEARGKVADFGENLVRDRLHGVLKHPTGHYQSRITINRMSQRDIITDSGIIYGPWLEGVGSRNRSTRFKGYHTFRRVRQELKRLAPQIAEHLTDRLVRRLS